MSKDPAQTRWLAIQLVRWIGLAIFLFGLLIVADQIDLPEIAGYALMGVGLLDSLLMPTFLARRWKTRL